MNPNYLPISPMLKSAPGVFVVSEVESKAGVDVVEEAVSLAVDLKDMLPGLAREEVWVYGKVGLV